MSEQKTKSTMILNGFLFGLFASSTGLYGYALGSHWAKGLRTSAMDEVVFIFTVLLTVFYGQAFVSSYQAYQRIYSHSLHSITMYVPNPSATNEKLVRSASNSSVNNPNPSTLSSQGSIAGMLSPATSRSSMGSASPAGTIVGTPSSSSAFSPDGGIRFHASSAPMGLYLPSRIVGRSVSPSPTAQSNANTKPNGEQNRRCSDEIHGANEFGRGRRTMSKFGIGRGMSAEDLSGYENEYGVERGQGQGLMGLGMGAIEAGAGGGNVCVAAGGGGAVTGNHN